MVSDIVKQRGHRPIFVLAAGGRQRREGRTASKRWLSYQGDMKTLLSLATFKLISESDTASVLISLWGDHDAVFFASTGLQ